jgi:hypothetical protein
MSAVDVVHEIANDFVKSMLLLGLIAFLIACCRPIRARIHHHTTRALRRAVRHEPAAALAADPYEYAEYAPAPMAQRPLAEPTGPGWTAEPEAEKPPHPEGLPTSPGRLRKGRPHYKQLHREIAEHLGGHQ